MTNEPREHYRRASDVYRELGRLDDYPTIGNNDFVGWYIKRDVEDPELIESGWPQEGRVVRLDADIDTLVDRIDRTLYAITTYKDPSAFERWVPCRYDSDDKQTVWRDDKPTPGFEDLRAIPAWGDIDLADELKEKRGGLDSDTKQTIEDALSAYIDEYAELYGTADAVYALDSVGGAYIFGAPEATLPITELFADDDDACARVTEEFIDRSNEWLEAAESRVNEQIEGASDVIHPDWVNNYNRQYKAPLSIHKSHDAVVTPLDTADPDYSITWVGDVDDDLVSASVEWAKSFTSVDHIHCVENLVAQLWPDEYEQHGDWQTALTAWVDLQREQEREQERQRREALQAREEHEANLEGLPITPSIHDVYEAVDRLDIVEVAERTIVHQWTDQASGKRDTSGSGKRAFVPIWGPNAEGTANYINIEKGTWVDTGQNHHGTAVEMALIATGAWTRGKIADGADWARGVDELRKMGYDLPVWTPDATTSDDDRMPYWSLCKAAVALEVASPDEFIEREGDDGGTYLGLPADLYDEAIEAVEAAGLEPNRQPLADQQVNDLRILIGNHIGEDDDDMSPGVKRYFGRLLGEIDDDDFGEVVDEAAAVLDVEPRDIQEHRRLYGLIPQALARPGKVPEHALVEDGMVWWVDGVPLDTSREPILDFAIDVKEKLYPPDGSLKATIEITDKNDETFEVVISPSIFNEKREFDSALLGESFATTFNTQDHNVEPALDELRKMVDRSDAPKRKGTYYMGLHDSEFVLPSGSMTANGWSDDPEYVYIHRQADGGVAIENNVEIPADRDDYDEEAVATILRELPRTRDIERYLPVLGWFYTAPLRPIIFDLEGQFNLLNVTGDTGSGKTTTLRYLWKCFGMAGDPMASPDSKFATLRTLASTNSIPLWFDEYKPSEMSDYEERYFHDFIRKTATGGIEQRGRPDQTTVAYHLKAPAVISGEQQIDRPAERRRSILTSFRKTTTDSDSETSLAYKKLVGEAYEADGELEIPEGCPDPRDHALAYYQWVVNLGEDEVRDRWHESRRAIMETRNRWEDGHDLDDLEVQALQTVAFGWSLYQDFAEAHGVDREELPGEMALDSALRYIAGEIGPGGKRKSHLEEFIQLMYRATVNEFLEPGRHFSIVHEGQESEELRFNINRTYDVISKYVRDHDLSDDLLGTANDYRKRLKEVHESNDPLVVSYSQKTPGLGRCVGIRTVLAEERLDFERQAFGAMPMGDEPDEEPEQEDVPVTKLESQRGYQTITVTVVDWEAPEHEAAPERAGVAKDRTGAVDLISWHDMEPFGVPIHMGRSYRFRNVRVGEYDGAIQVEFIPNLTEIEPIQTGAGYTERADVDEDQGTLQTASAADSGNGNGATADEIEDSTSRVSHHVKAARRKGDVLNPAEVAGELGMNPEKVDHAMKKMAERGDLLKQDDGYEVT